MSTQSELCFSDEFTQICSTDSLVSFFDSFLLTGFILAEVKRRKRHRRKHVENQEPCIMRGVYFKNLKWQAAIKVDKKQIHLGTVGSQEEAARLYDRFHKHPSPLRLHHPNSIISPNLSIMILVSTWFPLVVKPLEKRSNLMLVLGSQCTFSS